MISTTDIIGYCQPYEIAANETTELKLSSNRPKTCSVKVMRIVCADIDPNGPGEEFVEQSWGEIQNLAIDKQEINAGSYAIVKPAPELTSVDTISVKMYIWPTKSSTNCQVIFNWGNVSFSIETDGKLAFKFGSKSITSPEPLLLREWYEIEGVINFKTNSFYLKNRMLNPVVGYLAKYKAIAECAQTFLSTSKHPIIFGAKFKESIHQREFTSHHYNGKVEAPRIFVNKNKKPLVEWDFSKSITKAFVMDKGYSKFKATFINAPMRGATGYKWDGSVDSWREKPSHYGSIHFHEDDITDCEWQTLLKITPPAQARSGYYTARILADGVQSDVPFFITQRLRKSKNKILFLAPTATYKAYANTHVKFDSHNTENLFEAPISFSEDELYLNEHRELGLSHYDTHTDDSGVVYVGDRRPMLNNRPGLYTFNYINDTHIIKWLEKKNYDYEVATDEDLNRLGHSLLDDYKVVITASHPEYYSTEMWDALSYYQKNGGRHMYLGGNGFYWRIAYSDQYPGVIEHRRGVSGVRTWEGEPGEHHLSFTGEPGGLWRTYGRAPQSLVGNGFSSTMFVQSTYFRRSKESYGKETDFIFKNIDTDIIGDFGFRGGGCVGLEIDRWDQDLGSPHNSIVVATSENIGAGGLLTGEEFITTTRALDGNQNSRVRADMVFFTTQGGGAVWSTGSIAWATSLLWNDTKNTVSQVTQNVLNRFLENKKFELNE